MAGASEAASFRVSASAGSKHHGTATPQGLTAGRARDALVFAAGVAAALLALVGTALFLDPGGRGGLVTLPVPVPGPEDGPRTFYDDPELSYAVASGRRLTGWDAKRAEWLRSRGLGRRNAPERVVMVSGSQPEP